METHFLISAKGPYFTIFYLLAFTSGLFVLLAEGRKRKFPMLSWILLLSFAWISFVAGSKLIILSPDDWNFFLNSGHLPPTSNKNLLGGIVAGTIALIAGKYLVSFRQNFADAFAFALPLSVGIQRIGCFLTGCCHGKPTHLPWAVQYPEGTLPHFHQFQSHLISDQNLFSLPVHPVQLYETAGCLIVLLALIWIRKYLKASGSLFLASCILFLSERFITEFFRDPLAHTSFFNNEGTITQFQWIILALIFACTLFLLKREFKFRIKPDSQSHGDFNSYGTTGIMLLIFLIYWPLRNWFTPTEIISLFLCMITGFAMYLSHVLKKIKFTPAYRILLFALILPFLLMSQTLPQAYKDSVRKFNTLDIGFASGKYFNNHEHFTGEGCDRTSQTSYFKQKYTLGGARFSFSKENAYTEEGVHYGLQAMMGRHQETNLENQVSESNILWGFTPFLGFDTRWIGMEGGIHLGNLAYTTENIENEGTTKPVTGTVKAGILPQFYMRIGPEKVLFADFHYLEMFPSAMPGCRIQLGIGSGFGQENGLILRTGYTGNGYYVSGYFPLNNHLILQPMLLFNDKPYVMYSDQSTIKTDNGFQFLLGLGYRFEH